jgi:solute:Na+ symporter, SSS family
MLWLLAIGAIYTLRIKNTADLFAAGYQSPWWISGISGYMTIFSSATFVVWGGIAYRDGFVAITILTVTGLSTVLIGATVAARWRQMNITTPAAFLRIRFTEAVVQAYTWIGIVYRGIGMAVGLYALAIMLAALVPLPEGTPFRDNDTGNLSVNWSIVLWGAIIVAYTMAGGLWAVLITDVIQCIILCLAILVAVPLSLSEVGGVDRFINDAPEGFFSPVAGDYTYNFFFLWFWIGYFRYAADWSFVQRYICVPTPRDARKVAYLMGGLYVISPLFWLLPAMCYHFVQSDIDPEQAYILMCRKVLPQGMMGILVAAMFSATASGISTLLIVFAGVFTCDVYRPFINPKASDRQLLFVGRLTTFVYGVLVVLIAMSVPHLGNAEDWILMLVTSLMGPLMLPVVWALYSRHINHRAVWVTLAVCGAALLAWRIYLAINNGNGADPEINPRFVDAFIGLVLPLIILIIMEIQSRGSQLDAGWTRMQAALDSYLPVASPITASRLPMQIVTASFLMLGITMLFVTLSATRQQGTLAAFSFLLFATAIIAGFFSLRKMHKD